MYAKSVIIDKENVTASDTAEYFGYEIIEFSENVRFIGKDAFKNFINLEQIILHEGLREIKQSAFYGCKHLEYVRIGRCFGFPKSLYCIEREAFAFTSVHSITDLHSCIIDESAFEGSGIDKLPKISCMSEIPHATFRGCKNLEGVTIPYNIVKISSEAFSNSGLKTIAFIKNHTLRIASDAFSDCKLENVIFNVVCEIACSNWSWLHGVDIVITKNHPQEALFRQLGKSLTILEEE